MGKHKNGAQYTSLAAMAEGGDHGQSRTVTVVTAVVAVFALIAGGAVGLGVLRSYQDVDAISKDHTRAFPSDTARTTSPAPSTSATPGGSAQMQNDPFGERQESTGTITGPADVHLCIQVGGNRPVDGAPVQLSHCDHTQRQQWTMEADHTIRAFGKCLDIVGGRMTNRSKTQLWTCDGSDGQWWEPAADGALKNTPSGRCLDDPKGDTGNGTRLQIYDCNHRYPQRWNTPAVP